MAGLPCVSAGTLVQLSADDDPRADPRPRADVEQMADIARGTEIQLSLCPSICLIVNGDRDRKQVFQDGPQIDHFPAKVGCEQHNAVLVDHPRNTYTNPYDAIR
ncbi:hypothetical protein D3C75_835340 [compost metagenome]